VEEEGGGGGGWGRRVLSWRWKKKKIDFVEPASRERRVCGGKAYALSVPFANKTPAVGGGGTYTGRIGIQGPTAPFPLSFDKLFLIIKSALGK
jgi:hypothetical protein